MWYDHAWRIVTDFASLIAFLRIGHQAQYLEFVNNETERTKNSILDYRSLAKMFVLPFGSGEAR